MAIYHLSVKAVSRSKGQSSTASAAYRAAEKIKDERTGEIHDYTKKKGVIENILIFPAGVSYSRSELWNEAEKAENRKNSTVAREYEIALPVELSLEDRSRLAKEFTGWVVENYGVGADLTIHEPNKKGDERNAHAHILTTTRRIGAGGFGEKTRCLDDKKTGEVEKIREKWEQLCNRELARVGKKEISRKSLEAQGIDCPATVHMGKAATAIERRGGESNRGNLNRALAKLPAMRKTVNELGLKIYVENTLEPPRTSEKPPSLKNARNLSPEEASAVLDSLTAQIAEKPLETFAAERKKARKELDKDRKAWDEEYRSLRKNEPLPRWWHSIIGRSGFDKQHRAWHKTTEAARHKTIDLYNAWKSFDQETAAGSRKIEYDARVQAGKERPDAQKVVTADYERREAERQAKTKALVEKRQQERARSKSKGRGEGLGR